VTALVLELSPVSSWLLVLAVAVVIVLALRAHHHHLVTGDRAYRKAVDARINKVLPRGEAAEKWAANRDELKQ
jgi:hypothetical protein